MGAFGQSTEDDEEEDDMGAMEAAIEKMSRLVKHVAGSGAQGNHMAGQYPKPST
jgi:hypothetical protein